MAIAESITESRELAGQATDGAQFIITHILQFRDCTSDHQMKMFSRLGKFRSMDQTRVTTTKGRSIGSVSSKEDVIRNGTLLQRDLMSGSDGPIFEISLAAVRESLRNPDLSICDWPGLSSIGELLCVHLNRILCDLTSSITLTSPIHTIRRRTDDVISAFTPFVLLFTSGMSLKNMPVEMAAAKGVINVILLATVCSGLAWSLSSGSPYTSISPYLDHVATMATAMLSLDGVESGLCEGCTISVHTVLLFLSSIKVIHYLEQSAIKEVIRSSVAVSGYWRDAIKAQVESSKTVDSTIKLSTAVSNTRKVLSAFSQDPVHVINGISLVACACVGAVVQFRGIAMGGITAVESLCVTQHAITVVAALKQTFSKVSSSVIGGEPDILLRPVLSELALLARVRVLEGMGQHAAAVDEAVFRGYLVVSSVLGGDGSQYEDLSLSQRKKRIEKLKNVKSESNNEDVFLVDVLGKSVKVDETVRSKISSPVAQWIYTSLLTDIGLHSESIDSVDYFLSSSVQSISSWLSAERAWALLLRAVKEKRSKSSSSVHAGDVLASFGLLRDMELGQEICSIVISALFSVLSSQDSTTIEIEPTVRYRLGVAMWLAGGVLKSDKSKCLATLLGAAKLDPHLGSVYTFIGHYYLDIMKDTMRATKCYLKALAYNPMDTEAGVTLSHIYIESGDTAAAIKLWGDVKALTASHASWCFALEGHYHLTLENYDEAVESFRKSLELNDDDAHMWFGLGLSYFFLLQNNAALKSLQRAFDIMESRGGNTVYILQVQAEVERRMGQLHSALEHFEVVCGSQQSDVVSQKGLADVCLALAYERYTMGWTRGAALCITKGLHTLDQIPGVLNTVSSNMSIDNVTILSSVLKLRGDLCCFARHLGSSDLTATAESQDDMWSYDSILKLLQQAEENYRRVLALSEQQGVNGVVLKDDIAAAWYDIGCAAYYQAVVLATAMGQGSGITPSQTLIRIKSAHHSFSPLDQLQSALVAFLHGIRAGEGPVHSGCWNGIGLCIRNNDALRELCFVIAARIDASPTAYANISLLLLMHHLDSEAKECLSALQLMEANPLHWVTLGTLMERSLALSASELSDLQAAVPVYDSYCAAIEVAKPADAWLGLALAWMRVKGLIKSSSGELSESFGSIKRQGVTAIDVKYFVEVPLKLFLHRRSVHPYAWVLLGWALGFRGHYQQAIEAYSKAIYCLDIAAMYVDNIVSAGNSSNDSGGMAYSVNAVRVTLANILSGINRCVSAGRFSDKYQNLLDQAQNGLSPNKCKYVQKLLPDITIGIEATLSSVDSVESRGISFCDGEKYSECVDMLYSEFTKQMDSSKVADVVRIVEVSFLVLRRHSSFLVDLCSKLLSVFAAAIQNKDDSSRSIRDSTALSLITSSVSNVCDIASCLLYSGDKLMTVSVQMIRDVLDFALDNHPENDQVLRLLAICDKNNRTQYALQSLGMASSKLTATYDLEERFDVEQSLLCHLSQEMGSAKLRCRCSEIALREIHNIVPAYCDSVNMAVGDAIARGRRSDRENKKHLMRALLYNPSDMHTWNMLASQIFSDNVLGSRPPEVDLSTLGSDDCGSGSSSAAGESKGQNLTGVQLPAVMGGGDWGCFYGGPYMDLCREIITLSQREAVKSSNSTNPSEYNCMCDLVSSMSSQGASNGVHKARQLFQEGKYRECIDYYRQEIAKIVSESSDRYNVAYAAQLWNELGHVFSNGLCPEGAEYCYGIALDTHSAAGMVGNVSDVARGYSRVMSAIAYLHRFHSSSDINDANKAKAICEECVQTDIRGSVQAVGYAVAAAVWIAQGKAKKCNSELQKAKMAWSELEIPSSIFEKHF